MEKNLLDLLKEEIREVKIEFHPSQEDTLELACGGIIFSGSCGTNMDR